VNNELSLGDSCLSIQKIDLNNCIAYFKQFKIDPAVFNGNNLALAKYAHQVAFTMGLWVQKTTETPSWAKLYLQQLKTDSVQLIPSIVLGNKRTLHLYERSCIEDFLRYFYYFDHKIEHILLQSYPTKFETIDFLINWIKRYPVFTAFQEVVEESCNNLTSGYKELSRTVHGTIVTEITLGDNLAGLFQPLQHPVKERDLMTLVFSNIFFLLSLFHNSIYRRLELDEIKLVCQHLSEKQKRFLSDFVQ
jgi:hypothetical protein